MIKKWFSQELSDYKLWNEYQQLMYKYLDKEDTFLRIPIYKMHLNLLAHPKWNNQYTHTSEFLFVREAFSKNKNVELYSNLKKTLLLKYHSMEQAQIEASNKKAS